MSIIRNPAEKKEAVKKTEEAGDRGRWLGEHCHRNQGEGPTASAGGVR